MVVLSASKSANFIDRSEDERVPGVPPWPACQAGLALDLPALVQPIVVPTPQKFRSAATALTVLPPSKTRRTAPSLNSGVNFLRGQRPPLFLFGFVTFPSFIMSTEIDHFQLEYWAAKRLGCSRTRGVAQSISSSIQRESSVSPKIGQHFCAFLFVVDWTNELARQYRYPTL